jgi:nitrogen regulatory protein PII 2
MKEIIAIIRPRKMGQTKETLTALGFPSFMATRVLGRGHQRGIAGEIGCDLPPELLGQGKSGGMKYIPKRLIAVVVRDADVDTVVRAIITVNQTAQIGDGKVFVCSVEEALRVRTDERGEQAVL